jgi:hypothetical protein
MLKKLIKILIFALCLIISWISGYGWGMQAEYNCYEDLISSHTRMCEAFTGKNLLEFEVIDLENGEKTQ